MSEKRESMDRLLLRGIGNKLKALRKQRSMSLDKLSRLADVSMRYVLQVEQGQANLSVLKLLHLAQALDVDVKVFFEDQLDLCSVLHKKKMLSFLGVRGAGKSSIGNALVLMLNQVQSDVHWELVELDRCIERKAGLYLGQIFSMYGESRYRALEKECLDELEKNQSSQQAMILITGGSIVTSEENYQKLKQLSVTVFLKAQAQDHWERVIQQGDHRPMENHPKAFKELEQLLGERASLYAQADLILDTHQKSIDQCVTALMTELKLNLINKENDI